MKTTTQRRSRHGAAPPERHAPPTPAKHGSALPSLWRPVRRGSVVVLSFVVGFLLSTVLHWQASAPAQKHGWAPEVGHEIRHLPLCNRLVLHASAQFNGLGSQTIRVLAGFLLANDMNATWAWFPGSPWNYQCAPGRNWDCYFEQPYTQCRYEKLGRWELADIDHVVDWFLAGSDECEPVSLIDRNESDGVNAWVPVLKERAPVLWNSRTNVHPDIGPIQCKSHARVLDSNMVLSYFETKYDQLPPKAALIKHRIDIRRVWKPVKDIRDALASARKRLGLNVARSPLVGSSNYIAVHLRRGDKEIEAPHIKLEFYAAAIRFAQEKTGLRKVFVATDDGSVIEELAAALADIGTELVGIEGAREREGHRQMQFNRGENTADLVYDLIIEIEILAHGAFLIGTSSSAVSRIAHMLRPPNEAASSSVFLDRVWNRGLWWKTFPRYCGTMLSPEESGRNLEFCEKYGPMLEEIEIKRRSLPPHRPLTWFPFISPRQPPTNDGKGYQVDTTRRTYPYAANVACETQPMQLSCSRDPNVAGSSVRVTSATFGRSVSGWPVCRSQAEPFLADRECGQAGNALRAVRAQCESRPSCVLLVAELEIDREGAEELCPTTRKYLNVTYECV